MKNGLYCSAGKNWFSIGSDGGVYQCNVLVYNKEAFLGNIVEDEQPITLRAEKYKRCPIQECQQVCDRHWSQKINFKEDQQIDFQDFINPQPFQARQNPVSILWAPTWKCNYSCPYCTLPTENKTFAYDRWISAFSRFFDHNQIDGGILHTNGGEPLFYKDIEKVFAFFHSRKFVVAVTTNLSSDVWKTVINAAPPSAFGAINCSLHPADKNFRWELFRSRVAALKAMNYPVSVNFVGHPDQLMLAPEYAAYFKSMGVNFSLIPMIGPVGDFRFLKIEDYPEPMRKIIYQHTSQSLSDDNRFIEGKRVGGKASNIR